MCCRVNSDVKNSTVLRLYFCACVCVRLAAPTISHSHIAGHRLLLRVRWRCEDININWNTLRCETIVVFITVRLARWRKKIFVRYFFLSSNLNKDCALSDHMHSHPNTPILVFLFSWFNFLFINTMNTSICLTQRLHRSSMLAEQQLQCSVCASTQGAFRHSVEWRSPKFWQSLEPQYAVTVVTH